MVDDKIVAQVDIDSDQISLYMKIRVLKSLNTEFP